MGKIPVAWWLSPAWELTLNIGVISAPYSSWACLLLCAIMKFCWLTFKLLQQSHPETLPPSVCLQTVVHSHLLHQGQRKIGSGERQVSAFSFAAKPAPRLSAVPVAQAEWMLAAGLDWVSKKTWEGRRFWWIWSTWWCKASLNNFENINWWKIETGSKKCTQFLSSLLCLQYHLVEIDVACHGLNRQGAYNPKCSYGTQKDRIFWKNS